HPDSVPRLTHSPTRLQQQLEGLFLRHVSELQASRRHANNRPITCGHQHLEQRKNRVHDLAFPHIIQDHQAWGVARGCHRTQVLLNLLQAVQDVRHPVRGVRRCCAHLPDQALEERQKAFLC
ncbi:unnamed protein product, partial [Ectocarpus sp. 12 AP-2014]